jgi:hypothetical protein
VPLSVLVLRMDGLVTLVLQIVLYCQMSVRIGTLCIVSALVELAAG